MRGRESSSEERIQGKNMEVRSEWVILTKISQRNKGNKRKQES